MIRLAETDAPVRVDSQNPINARKGITTQRGPKSACGTPRRRQNPINARKGITTHSFSPFLSLLYLASESY